MRREICVWNLAFGVIVHLSMLKGAPEVHIIRKDGRGMSVAKMQLLDMIIADDCKGVYTYQLMNQQKEIAAAKAACQAMFRKFKSLELWEQEPCMQPASADCLPVREGFPCIGGKTVHRCAVKIVSPLLVNHLETRSLKSCFKQEVKDRKKEKRPASAARPQPKPQTKPTGSNIASTSGAGKGKGKAPIGSTPTPSRPLPKPQSKPTGSNIASTSGVGKGKGQASTPKGQTPKPKAQTPKPKGTAQPKSKGTAQPKPQGPVKKKSTTKRTSFNV